MRELLEFTPGNLFPVQKVDHWGSLWNEQLGCQVRFLQGVRWRHRIVESGSLDNPNLLLLHGFGAHAEWWARNMANLGKSFHVVAPDLVFHGKSGKDGWDRRDWVRLLADGVTDLMDVLRWKEAFVEGASLGAHVAFNLAMRYPKRCHRVILSTGLPHIRSVDDARVATRRPNSSYLAEQAIRQPSFETIRVWMQKLVAEPGRMTDEMVELRARLYRDPVLNTSMRQLYGIDTKLPEKKIYALEEVNSFSPSVLLIWTEKNPGTSWKTASQRACMIPNSRYHIIGDAGHWPQWEKPEEHDHLVAEWFLAG